MKFLMTLILLGSTFAWARGAKSPKHYPKPGTYRPSANGFCALHLEWADEEKTKLLVEAINDPVSPFGYNNGYCRDAGLITTLDCKENQKVCTITWSESSFDKYTFLPDGDFLEEIDGITNYGYVKGVLKYHRLK